MYLIPFLYLHFILQWKPLDGRFLSTWVMTSLLETSAPAFFLDGQRIGRLSLMLAGRMYPRHVVIYWSFCICMEENIFNDIPVHQVWSGNIEMIYKICHFLVNYWVIVFRVFQRSTFWRESFRSPSGLYFWMDTTCEIPKILLPL